jgi:Rnl2 family RNA ligase
MKNLPFNSYDKISESVTNLQINEAGYRLFDKTDWVVTEKVHGANLCFVTDGIEIRGAKRKEFIAEGDTFFNYQRLLKKLESQINQVFSLVQESYPSVNVILIYGELFGGGYPHPDVTPDPLVNLVQTGVYYSPTIAFYGFDIAIALEESSGQQFYLDYDRTLEIFQETGIFHARPLFVGKYHAACDYPIEFESHLPAWLGLPPLSNNLAEGVVIKPMKSIYVETKKGKIRPIFKQKIPAFTEDKRFHQAQQWPNERSPIEPDYLSLLKWEVFNLITENRLNNVISKIGRDDRSQSRKIFRLFIEDIFEELRDNQAPLLASVTADEIQQLTAYTQAEARKLFQ